MTPNPSSQRSTDGSTTSGAWKPPGPTSPGRQDPSRSAWISAQARLVVSSYRRDDFADADGFSIQLGMVLERYADEVIRDITSPLTGIQRKSKFPPTIAEVVTMCDEEVARLDRIRRFAQLRYEPREPMPKRHRANVFVRPEAPQYAAMMAKAKLKTTSREEWRYDTERPGIWVALGWLDDEQGTTAKGWRTFTGDELMAMHGVPRWEDGATAYEPAKGDAANG